MRPIIRQRQTERQRKKQRETERKFFWVLQYLLLPTEKKDRDGDTNRMRETWGTGN